MIITFGIESSDNPEMAIVMDYNGIEYLIYKLNLLKNEQGHAHMMSNEWGGELTVSNLEEDFKIVHSVRLVHLNR